MVTEQHLDESIEDLSNSLKSEYEECIIAELNFSRKKICFYGIIQKSNR